MKILGLKVEAEDIGEERVERSSNVFNCLWGDIGWSV
jgi:hypothetical protein